MYTGEQTPASTLVLAHADGTGAHTIAHGEYPALSPDGRWVAYDVCCARGPVQKLFVVATSGGKPRLLARTDSWPVWSPSSDRIATLKGNALVSIDLHGHVTVLDTNATAGSDGWSFSPDGRWIAYDAARETDCTNLYVGV